MGLLPREHSGRPRPHEHTSYAALALVVLVGGVMLAAASGRVKADPPPVQHDINVTGNVMTGAPVITYPATGQHFSQQGVTVRGTCTPKVVVEVFKNGLLAGSTDCDDSGQFTLPIDLLVGRNDLVARHYWPGPISPYSNTVTVYYDVPVASTPPGKPSVTASSQFVITSDKGYQGADIKTDIAWNLIISGGQTPYAISIDWGDGDVDVVNWPLPGTQTFHHSYDKPGQYQVTVKGQDAGGQTAELRLRVSVSGPVPALTTKTDNGLLAMLWPLYFAMAVILLSFWLGERYEKWYIRRHLYREGLL